jgi:hypothetical protein
MMNDNLFPAPGPPKAKSWRNSDAKKLLQHDLATGIIPLSGRVMNAAAVFATRPEYALFPENKFANRLSKLRTEARTCNTRRDIDNVAYEHDRRLYPHEGGVLRWEGSAAEQLLKEDITAGLHLQMKPLALYQSREAFQQFSLTTFRGHIYQEIKRRKFVTSYYGR